MALALVERKKIALAYRSCSKVKLPAKLGLAGPQRLAAGPGRPWAPGVWAGELEPLPGGMKNPGTKGLCLPGAIPGLGVGPCQDSLVEPLLRMGLTGGGAGAGGATAAGATTWDGKLSGESDKLSREFCLARPVLSGQEKR